MSNAIIENRWLTGADIDPESVRINKNGSFWLGDEFEPFLINPYTSGKVLCQEIPLPAARCPLSCHQIILIEIMRPQIYLLLAVLKGWQLILQAIRFTRCWKLQCRATLKKSLRIYQFDINTVSYNKVFYRYQLSAGTSIGDFVAVNEHEFLVLERNDAAAITDRLIKKVYLIDINQIDNAQFVHK